MSTTLAKPDTEKKWYVVDLKGQVLGRAAVKIANILRGRHKAIYTPHIDAGDYVIVVNAGDYVLTGKKADQMTYMTYSGYRGREKYIPVKTMHEKRPEYMIWHAVEGMMPNNRIARQMMKKLKLFTTSEHTHEAQNPTLLEI